MTETNIENYILGLDPETITEEELQKAHAKIASLRPWGIFNCYGKWSVNKLLKYRVAYNIFNLDSNNKEYLYKACEFNDSIEITEEDSYMVVYELNNHFRKDLLEKLIEYDDQESLDKAYHILIEQILLNPEGIDIEEAIQLTEGLLDKYRELGKENNEHKINNLENELNELKEEVEIDYILKLNPKTLEKEQLQKVYKTVKRLRNYYVDMGYKKFKKNQLMYEVASNIFNLDIDNKEYLDKACELNDSIKITERDSSMVRELNSCLRKDLLEELIKYDDQESLDKAYHILIEQILLNPEGILVKNLIQLTEGLLNKYHKLDEKKNENEIKNLTNELEKLKEQEEEATKYILELNPKTLGKEQLRDVYVKTIELCCDDNNDRYETWNENELMYEVASNILYLYRNNKKYLYKACEFNDSIEITEKDSSMVRKLNMYLREDLLEELIEFGDQESLDKAYHILFDQLLPNPEGITVKKAIQLTEGLLDKYHKLDEKTNENEIKNLKNELKKVSKQKIEEEKEEEKKQTNPRITTNKDLQQQSNNLNSMNEEFNIVEAEQQATTFNENIGNYGFSN